MPWKRLPNDRRSKLPANWPSADDKYRVQHRCSPEEARRIALRDPKKNCFFFVRTGAPGVGSKYRPGDAVFFSLDVNIVRDLVDGGTSFSPEENCDLYVKTGMTVAYYDPTGTQYRALPLASAGRYTTSDGGAAVDVVCIFAANLQHELIVQDGKGNNITYTGLADRSLVHHSIVCGNPKIYYLLNSKNGIQDLQSKGITVLLTVMPNRQNIGWSSFDSVGDQADASAVARQCKAAVEKYGLDGIDIDDEYSSAPVKIRNSLAMLSAKLRFEMPDRIITKALFDDDDYFGDVGASAATYTGKGGGEVFELEDMLTYGWEMSYWQRPEQVMGKYIKPGRMSKEKLLKGFNLEHPQRVSEQYTDTTRATVTDVQWLKREGYAGVMFFGFQFQQGQDLMGELVNRYLGPGNWNDNDNNPNH